MHPSSPKARWSDLMLNNWKKSKTPEFLKTLEYGNIYEHTHKDLQVILNERDENEVYYPEKVLAE